MTWSFGAGGRIRRHALVYSDGDWWYDPVSNDFGFRTGGRQAREWTDVTWEFPGPAEYSEIASRAEPGWFASKGEKALRSALIAGNAHAIDLVGGQHPEYRSTSDVLVGLLSLDTRRNYAAEALERSLTADYEPRDDPFIRKYLSSAGVGVPIAPGVAIALPIMRVAVALTVAELRQASADLDAAILALFAVERTTHVTLSLAELFNAARRFSDTVDATPDTVNDDDVTAMTLAYRAIALRETGRPAEARAMLARVIAEGSRSAPVAAFVAVVNASMGDPKQRSGRAAD